MVAKLVSCWHGNASVVSSTMVLPCQRQSGCQLFVQIHQHPFWILISYIFAEIRWNIQLTVIEPLFGELRSRSNWRASVMWQFIKSSEVEFQTLFRHSVVYYFEFLALNCLLIDWFCRFGILHFCIVVVVVIHFLLEIRGEMKNLRKKALFTRTLSGRLWSCYSSRHGADNR